MMNAGMLTCGIMCLALSAFVASCSGNLTSGDSNDAHPSEIQSTTLDPGIIVDNTPQPSVTPRPAGFASIDFSNYKLPFGQLRKGEYSVESPDGAGETHYSLSSVHFADLDNEPGPEAVVLIDKLSCAVSCDAGALQIYFYKSGPHGPLPAGHLITGSRADGCSVKSLSISERKIRLVQFGECTKRPDTPENAQTAKFTIPDETESDYSFVNGRLHRESFSIRKTLGQSALNFSAEIEIK